MKSYKIIVWIIFILTYFFLCVGLYHHWNYICTSSLLIISTGTWGILNRLDERELKNDNK